ncbi:MAG: hypothetical protein IPK85_01510 [Gemmatimonadetes bacterium]|nr:hypothetical protein [Gemmatimonadota bacterium]
MAGGHLNIGHNLVAFTSRSGAYPAGRGSSRTSLRAAAEALVENMRCDGNGRWVTIEYTRAQGTPSHTTMTVWIGHPTTVRGLDTDAALTLFKAGQRILERC